MLAGRRARRVGDRLLAGEQERLLGQAPAGDLVQRAAQLGDGAADVHRARAPRVVVGPRDRRVERPVELDRLRAVAKAQRAAHVGVAERVAGERHEAVRRRRRDDDPRRDRLAAGERRPPLDAAAACVDALGAAPTSRASPPCSRRQRDERVGDAARAALGARPADGVAHEVQPQRRRSRCRRRPAARRRAARSRTATPRPRRGRPRRRAPRPDISSSARELERALRAAARRRAAPARDRRKARQHRRPHRLPVAQVGLDERLPARAVARRQRVEVRARAREVARRAPRARPPGSGWAIASSGWIQRSPWRSSSSSREAPATRPPPGARRRRRRGESPAASAPRSRARRRARGAASTTSTERPARASVIAATRPLGPEPMTTAS